jgi:DNA helicase-2/ATP-dependent DNA helicase PcrA
MAKIGGGPDLLSGLNPEQREAVAATEGAVLVLAGAGTGKTRVLTTRIAHILAKGLARPHEILAVTFTNKAAREMKERITALIGPSAEGLRWHGTFHAISTKMLRRHAELACLKPNFTILDPDDQTRLLKQVIKAADIDEVRWPARALAGLIDGWKNRGLSPSKVPVAEAGDFAEGRGALLYALYQERLKTLNAADFGDLLMETLRLLLENPDVLRGYHQRFKYILVDEYQDTNAVQYMWLRLLARRTDPVQRPNLCCVGDDDQSIYGWRGADVDNILRFEKDFPGAKVVRLERNYRSTGHILASAAHLISRNRDRLGKTLFTDGESGEKPEVFGVWDSMEEARAISDDIESLQRKGHPLDQMAILVRASFQMREFEERFIALGLPYRVVGGPRFYERMEVRDALAYLRVVAQPADDLAFERVLNTPKRGLGDATLQALVGFARCRGIPLTRAARVMVETEELKPKQRTTLRALVADFDRWTGEIGSKPHAEVAEQILEESGYCEQWRRERSPDAVGRLDNLKEFVRSMEEFPDLGAFLEHVSLVMDADKADDGQRVTIMTLHGAKGLEFDTVYLPGWEDGLFPHQRSIDESGRAGLEEERRLAYVGITRARKRAKIYFAANRRVHGTWQTMTPSRFLDDLPAAHVEVGERRGSSNGSHSRSPHQSAERWQEAPGWRRAQSGGYAGSPPTIEGEVTSRSWTGSSFKTGDRVFHLKFGHGNVAEVDGEKLTVDFDKAGRKIVLDTFVDRNGS